MTRIHSKRLYVNSFSLTWKSAGRARTACWVENSNVVIWAFNAVEATVGQPDESIARGSWIWAANVVHLVAVVSCLMEKKMNVK